MSDTIINNKTNKSNVLSVFDFDGTLTHYDSFIPFLDFAFNKRYIIKRLTKMILPVFCNILRKITRDELKEIFIKTFLTGIDENWLCQRAEAFCNRYWKKLLRPTSVIAIEEEVNSGAEVIICSASPTLILQPWANKFGVKLIGTQLEVINGKLTGRIVGQNCRCAQKIEKLKHVYGDLSQYHIRAWGDNRGDYELLMAAQDSYWKHFHQTYRRNNSKIKKFKVRNITQSSS